MNLTASADNTRKGSIQTTVILHNLNVAALRAEQFLHPFRAIGMKLKAEHSPFRSNSDAAAIIAR